MGNTKFLKRLTLITLSILLMTAGFKIPANAFFNCSKKQCKSKQKTLLKRSVRSVSSFEDKDSSGNSGEEFDTNKSSSSSDNATNKSGSNDGSENATGPEKDDNDDEIGTNAPQDNIDLEACAANMAQLAVEKAFLSCQINTAARKANRVKNIYKGLQRRMNNLLNIMKRAPVCSGQGYTLNEFDLNHSIENNVENMSNIANDIGALNNQVSNIVLGCDNCDDPTAMNDAMAKLNAIKSDLSNKMTNFSAEIVDIESRFGDFINRLLEVINNPNNGLTVQAIMAECRVNRRRAARMLRRRLRVVRAIRSLIQFRNRLSDRLADVDFGSDDCVKAQPNPNGIANACAAKPKIDDDTDIPDPVHNDADKADDDLNS